MRHCDADVLALVALGEAPADAADADHLEHCDVCRREADSLAEVVRVGRGAEQSLDQPPARVWQQISAQIHAEDSPTPLPRRRSSTWIRVAAAAACVVALVGSFALGRSTLATGSGSTVATAGLAPVPGGPVGGTGTATLLQHDGAYSVEVDTSGLPGANGFYEVWLMRPDDSGLVSLGTMSAGQQHGSFPVPAGLPLSAFTSVDVSDEPFDGNPGHSAVSVLRGSFTV